METLNTTLLNQIVGLQIDSDQNALTFVDRLCRENNWTHSYANRCVDEYKRFIYLAATASQPVTPSDEVDQVWHLHLTYTRSYWTDLCQTVLKKPLHHGPTKGGKLESWKYRSQYQATLERYIQVFKVEPPKEIWPVVEKRFHQVDKFVRLNTGDYFLLKKPSRSLLVVAAMPVFLTACVQGDNSMVIIVVALLLAFFYISYKIIAAMKDPKIKDAARNGVETGWRNNEARTDDGGDGGCGGCGGCGG